jgi:hypothetical protein
VALRRIVGISRGSRGNIVSVCVRGSDDLLTVAQVVDDIETARHSYIVDVGGHPSPVHVVHDRASGRAYLRTGPDRETANNLDFLPACATGPRLRSFPVRRDIATVGADERARLRDAILQLTSRYLVPGDRVSTWFKQDQIHQATHVHGVSSFLPWHRVLVNDFERQLQEIDPTLALHYWDWTTDPRRAPDRHGGGTVDLMTGDFIGASDGPIGSPFLERGFYQPAPPNRDEPQPGMHNAPPDPALPPGKVSRRVLTSGRGPREVTVDDIPELYGGDRPDARPSSEEQIRIRSDEEVVRRGLDPRPGEQYEQLWRAIYYHHGLAHRYIGGNIGGFGSGADVAHTSFEDPFVFLLHSNVERLWSSWQLSQEDFNAWEEPSWRVEPAWAYGRLIDDPNGSLELTTTMRPWDGRPPLIDPWGRPGGEVPIRAVDREVLRPGLYDRYTFEDNLCAAWATLLLGRRLSTHDVVRLSVELDAVSRDTVEIVLRTGPEVFWWKGIRLPDWTMIETEAANAEVSARHSAADLLGGQLIFHKAQGAVFPGRRIVFRVADLGWIPAGSRLTFLWEDD